MGISYFPTKGCGDIVPESHQWPGWSINANQAVENPIYSTSDWKSLVRLHWPSNPNIEEQWACGGKNLWAVTRWMQSAFCLLSSNLDILHKNSINVIAMSSCDSFPMILFYCLLCNKQSTVDINSHQSCIHQSTRNFSIPQFLHFALDWYKLRLWQQK